MNDSTQPRVRNLFHSKSNYKKKFLGRCNFATLLECHLVEQSQKSHAERTEV